MPIFDTFSRRKRRAEQTEADVYQYDDIPEKLRFQVCRIFSNSIGAYRAYEQFDQNNALWHNIAETVAQELGRRTLADGNDPKEDCLYFLQQEQNTDHWLDLVEISALAIDKICRGPKYDEYFRERKGITQTADDAIQELNFRFKEARLGYRYENGQIIQIDNDLLHAEVTKPALQLLSDPRFKGAEEEFREAHEHYRVHKYEDCITNALKAFESTLKTICDLKEWEYSKKSTASNLLKIVFREKLVPDYLDNSFTQLAATLQSGLPKVRNEAGGHGQGTGLRETPDYIAAYALHLAAAKIVLLVRAMQATEK